MIKYKPKTYKLDHLIVAVDDDFSALCHELEQDIERYIYLSILKKGLSVNGKAVNRCEVFDFILGQNGDVDVYVTYYGDFENYGKDGYADFTTEEPK